MYDESSALFPYYDRVYYSIIATLKFMGVIQCFSTILIENGVTASGFSLLDKEDFDDLGLTKIGKKLIVKMLPEIKGTVPSE